MFAPDTTTEKSSSSATRASTSYSSGLAVVAAVGAVREVRRPFGLVRAHGSMDDAQLVGDAPSLVGFARRERRRDGR